MATVGAVGIIMLMVCFWLFVNMLAGHGEYPATLLWSLGGIGGFLAVLGISVSFSSSEKSKHKIGARSK